uniref:Uncharacterized protein n=1 Tax=Oryza glumipatula TaxID=40148 RepID=A0A0D9ZHJ4_9ORYZ
MARAALQPAAEANNSRDDKRSPHRVTHRLIFTPAPAPGNDRGPDPTYPRGKKTASSPGPIGAGRTPGKLSAPSNAGRSSIAKQDVLYARREVGRKYCIPNKKKLGDDQNSEGVADITNPRVVCNARTNCARTPETRGHDEEEVLSQGGHRATIDPLH